MERGSLIVGMVWLGILFIGMVIASFGAFAASTLCVQLSTGNVCFNNSIITGTKLDFADIINAPSVADNSSWNQTLATSLYYLRTDGSLDNRSWNQTHANTLYYSISNPLGYYNSSTLPTGGNSSWNQTHANTLYYPLSSNPSNYLTSYSETDPLWTAARASYVNTTALAAYGYATTAQLSSVGNWTLDKPSYATNAHVANVNTTANVQRLGFNTTTQLDTRYLQSYTETDPTVNRSWNQTHANTLYYSITNPLGYYNSSTLPAGGNASWNETRANALYYPLSSNPSGYLTSYTETDPLWTGNATRVTNLESANVTLNAKVNTLVNLTLAQVANNIGNWTLDKPSYTTIAALAGAVGQNLTYALINTNMGNWSANRGAYLNTTNSLWTGNVTRISNLESANATTNASVTTLIGTVSGQATAITNLQTANNTLNNSVVSLNTKVGNLETWNATAISRIASVNTTANVQSLGFNTTTQLDSRYLQSFTESDPVWNGVRSEYVNLTRLNNATICRSDGTNCPAGSSLTLAQVAANVGNWTADRIAYINATTLDNATVCRSDGTNCPAGSSLTLAQVAANVGNWSNDKGSYLQNNSDVEFAKFNISGGNNITLGHHNYFWLNSTHKAPAYILGSVAGLRVLGGSLQVQSISLDSTLTGTAQAVIRVVNVSATNFNGTRMNLTEGVYASVGDFGSTNITASMVGALSTSENATICRTDGTNCPAGSSLTLAQVVANVGNWSLDKPSYATNAHVANVNTTANIVLLGFNTTVQLDSRYLQSFTETDPLWTAQRGAYLNTTNTLWTGNVTRITNLESANVTLNNKVNTLVNLTLAQVAANVGNWTLDKPSYALNTHVANVNTTALKNSTVANFTRLYLTGNLSLNNSHSAGSIADNSSCTMIYSPNRNSRIEICN
jgi:hypothetical protein